MPGRTIILWTTSFVRALFQRSAMGPIALTYYTKQDCSVCARGWPIAEQVARKHGVTITALNIETDLDLVARWGARAPVIAVEETVLAEGRFDARELRRALAAYRRPDESR